MKQGYFSSLIKVINHTPMKRIPLLFTLLIFFCLKLSAQSHKVIYQQFPIEDSVTQIQLHFTEPYEVISWSGHNVLVESYIEYQEAPVDLLIADIKSGFYDIESNEKNKIFILKSKPRVKSKNMSSGKDIVVFVMNKIYVPDDFAVVSKTEIFRPTELVLAEKPKEENNNKPNKK
jgi:hypothetical protein